MYYRRENLQEMIKEAVRDISVNSLRKKHNPSFEECMTTLSTQIAQSTPKSASKENLMVINSRKNNACIIDSQGNVEYVELPSLRGGRPYDK